MHRFTFNRNLTMPCNIHAAEIGDSTLSRRNLDCRPAQEGEGTRGLLTRNGIVARCVGRDALTMSQDHDEGDKRASRTTNGEDLSTFRRNELIPPANHGSR